MRLAVAGGHRDPVVVTLDRRHGRLEFDLGGRVLGKRVDQPSRTVGQLLAHRHVPGHGAVLEPGHPGEDVQARDLGAVRAEEEARPGHQEVAALGRQVQAAQPRVERDVEVLEPALIERLLPEADPRRGVVDGSYCVLEGQPFLHRQRTRRAARFTAERPGELRRRGADDQRRRVAVQLGLDAGLPAWSDPGPAVLDRLAGAGVLLQPRPCRPAGRAPRAPAPHARRRAGHVPRSDRRTLRRRQLPRSPFPSPRRLVSRRQGALHLLTELELLDLAG